MEELKEILKLQKELKECQQAVSSYEKLLSLHLITEKERKQFSSLKFVIKSINKKIELLKAESISPSKIYIGTEDDAQSYTVDSLLNQIYRKKLITDLKEADEIENVLNTYGGKRFEDLEKLLAEARKEMNLEGNDETLSDSNWITDEFKKHVSFEFETRDEVIEEAGNRGIELHSKIFFTKDYPLVNLKEEILAKNKDRSFYNTFIEKDCSPQEHAFTSKDKYYFITAGKNKEGVYEVKEEGLGNIQYMLKNTGKEVDDIPQYAINHLEAIAKTSTFEKRADTYLEPEEEDRFNEEEEDYLDYGEE